MYCYFFFAPLSQLVLWLTGNFLLFVWLFPLTTIQRQFVCQRETDFLLVTCDFWVLSKSFLRLTSIWGECVDLAQRVPPIPTASAEANCKLINTQMSESRFYGNVWPYVMCWIFAFKLCCKKLVVERGNTRGGGSGNHTGEVTVKLKLGAGSSSRPALSAGPCLHHRIKLSLTLWYSVTLTVNVTSHHELSWAEVTVSLKSS